LYVLKLQPTLLNSAAAAAAAGGKSMSFSKNQLLRIQLPTAGKA
jgi:hypothetical protein